MFKREWRAIHAMVLAEIIFQGSTSMLEKYLEGPMQHLNRLINFGSIDKINIYVLLINKLFSKDLQGFPSSSEPNSLLPLGEKRGTFEWGCQVKLKLPKYEHKLPIAPMRAPHKTSLT